MINLTENQNDNHNKTENNAQFLLLTINQLKFTTDKELERIYSQKRVVEETQSNLDLLLKRYNIEKSYFGSVAEWYGSKAWWIKIFIGLAITAIGAALGVLCHAPIIIAIVATVIYLFFTFLFIDHYNVTHKQTKLLCEDILELEKSLGETIKHYNELGERLQKIFESLYQMNTQMSSDLQQFETQISTLRMQIEQYNKIIDNLSQSEKKIVVSSEIIAEKLNHMATDYVSYRQILEQSSDNLISMTEQVSQVNINLRDQTESLRIVQQHYHQETELIAKTASQMNIIVAALQDKSNQVSESYSNKGAYTKLMNETDALLLLTEEKLQLHQAKHPDEQSINISEQVDLAIKASIQIQERAEAVFKQHSLPTMNEVNRTYQ